MLRTENSESTTGRKEARTSLTDPAFHVSLDQLPEIEREEILAARLEEQQREIDRQALGDLYKQTVGKDVESDEDEDAEGEEEDMDIDEDDEDEPPKKHVESNESDAEEPKRGSSRATTQRNSVS